MHTTITLPATSRSLPTNSSASAQIAPAVEFVRSPALTWQVNTINTRDEYGAYYLVMPPLTVEPYRPPPRLETFVIIRNEALLTGNRNAVAALVEYVLAEELPEERGIFIEQFVWEFGEGIRRDLHVLEVVAFHTHGPIKRQIE
ncbi:hypothetical protein DXG03_009514 [Asterophora parasitica]|uniref:Uncharacterized protein n=1 Tax=Asterophora parasitica TaxID=117018 RepID=A0A9P7G4U2_9AGAR|nr:hypothetical protein DXG03_009514 [Asterophora parasitica]